MRWNRIARTTSAAAGLDMWTNARLFGLLNVALADGYIGNWDSKRYYNRWRPETAVRQADTDGNPRDGRRSRLGPPVGFERGDAGIRLRAHHRGCSRGGRVDRSHRDR